MRKMNFRIFDRHNVEIGQVRTNDRGEVGLVIESENGVFGQDDHCFNVVLLNTGMIYRTLYEKPVSEEFILRDFDNLLDVKSIDITTYNKEVHEN